MKLKDLLIDLKDGASWGISKKYKYSTLYFVVIQSLD